MGRLPLLMVTESEKVGRRPAGHSGDARFLGYCRGAVGARALQGRRAPQGCTLLGVPQRNRGTAGVHGVGGSAEASLEQGCRRGALVWGCCTEAWVLQGRTCEAGCRRDAWI